MFRQILIPLDGSNLAEAALVPAATLAQTFGAQVILLHVIEKGAPEEIHKERHLTNAREALDYLQGVATSAFHPGTQVECHVHKTGVENVPESLVQHIGEIKPDLIVMCAHGRGGIRSLVLGNIAQQVVARSRTPILMLQPISGQPQQFQLRRMLVPLDSESVHDDSLSIAARLAQPFKCRIYLLTVIPTLRTLPGEKSAAGNLLPATTMTFLEMKAEQAEEHLKSHLNNLRRSGSKVAASTAPGDPAPVIASTAERLNIDLILVGTHRKKGLDAFWRRSVAPNISRRTKIPILFIPLEET